MIRYPAYAFYALLSLRVFWEWVLQVLVPVFATSEPECRFQPDGCPLPDARHAAGSMLLLVAPVLLMFLFIPYRRLVRRIARAASGAESKP